MSRLIDADKLLNKIDAYMCGSQDVMFVKELIKEQPTAFDVDDVMEKLEEEAFDMWICEEQFDMNSPYFKDVLYKVVKLCEAIEVVKAGGIDDNM